MGFKEKFQSKIKNFEQGRDRLRKLSEKRDELIQREKEIKEDISSALMAEEPTDKLHGELQKTRDDLEGIKKAIQLTQQFIVPLKKEYDKQQKREQHEARKKTIDAELEALRSRLVQESEAILNNEIEVLDGHGTLKKRPRASAGFNEIVAAMMQRVERGGGERQAAAPPPADWESYNQGPTVKIGGETRTGPSINAVNPLEEQKKAAEDREAVENKNRYKRNISATQYGGGGK